MLTRDVRTEADPPERVEDVEELVVERELGRRPIAERLVLRVVRRRTVRCRLVHRSPQILRPTSGGVWHRSDRRRSQRGRDRVSEMRDDATTAVADAAAATATTTATAHTSTKFAAILAKNPVSERTFL